MILDSGPNGFDASVQPCLRLSALRFKAHCRVFRPRDPSCFAADSGPGRRCCLWVTYTLAGRPETRATAAQQAGSSRRDR